MTYENPPLPEEVNVSRDSVVVEFLRLLAAVILLGALACAAIYVAGGWLARFIPFETEVAWAGGATVEKVFPSAAEEQGDAAIENYLQSLVDRLVAGMDLPAGMVVRAHYSDHEVPNAFATLGGHIIVTSGLYRRMPSENALAVVLAHEIGHVRARDPISALGGVATLQIMLVLLGGDANALTPYIAQVVLLGYSREAEQRADALAVEAVRRLYGHAGGAAATFEVLAGYVEEKGLASPSLLSTHPADADRIARMVEAARDWDRTRQPLQPLAVPDPSDGA